MFGLFKKKTEREKLEDKYEKLMRESFELSRLDRSKSDAKAAEAEEVRKKLDAMK